MVLGTYQRLRAKGASWAGTSLKVCCNHHILNITYRPLVLTIHLTNNALYEHKCLEKIKKVYKHSSKCDEQKQLKVILEAAMVSTPEVFTDDSPISTMTSTPVNKPSARKSLCIFQ